MSQPNIEQAFTDVTGHILHKQLKALLIELLKNAEMSFLLISLVNVFLSQPLPTSPYIIPSHTPSESMLPSQDTEIKRNSRTLAPLLPLLPFSFLYILQLH